jgi:hypothetical protein
MRWMVVICLYLTKVFVELVDRFRLSHRRRLVSKHQAESRAKRRARKLAEKLEKRRAAS